MKLVRYELAGQAHYGVLAGEDVRELLSSPYALRPEVGEVVGKLGSVKLLVPCEPSKIIGAANNYPWGENPQKSAEPLLFYKPLSSVISHEEDVVYPKQSREVIFESELAIVIGRKARNVPVSEARDYVLGYTCANDVSAYDLVATDPMKPFRAKSFDTFCPLGPIIETELDPSDVMITCRVNGEVRAQGSTKEMYYTCEELISYVSSIMTLLPGDVILSGTPDVGQIHPGDVVEVDIAGVGLLRNRVV